MVPQTFQLVMSVGPTPGKTYPLSKEEINLGRDASNDIVFDIVEVSRRHARMRLQAGGYILEDLGSTNGTFVNDQRLMGPHSLRPGETVSLGDVITLVYELAHHDPDATVVSTPIEMPAPEREEATPEPSAPPQDSPQPQGATPSQPAPSGPRQSYAGQVPPGPGAQAAPIEETKSRAWLWAGVGCLAVTLCALVAGAFAFDYLNLYCTPPFDLIFSFLYSCP